MKKILKMFLASCIAASLMVTSCVFSASAASATNSGSYPKCIDSEDIVITITPDSYVYNGDNGFRVVVKNKKTGIELKDNRDYCYDIKGAFTRKDGIYYNFVFSGIGNYMGMVCESVRLYRPGDTNLNGTLDINDATAIQYHLVKLRTLKGIQLEAADANGDGFVDINDVSYIQFALITGDYC